MRNSGKYFITFLIGSLGYPLIEVAARGYTHWSMMLTGGAAFLSFLIIHKYVGNKSLFIRAFYGMLSVTALEFSSGLVVNKLFSLNVWDYSGMKYNLLGQISLTFSLCWYIAAIMSFCIFDIVDFILAELKSAILQHRDSVPLPQ